MTQPEKYVIRTHDRVMFKDCRQRWNFSSKVRRNLELNVTSEYLVFGTDMHKGLDSWYDPNWIGSTRPAQQAYRDTTAVLAFYEAWEKRQEGVRLNVHTWDEYYELGHDMLRGYFDYARANDTFKPVRSEVEFEVPIPVPRYLWGKVLASTMFGLDLPGSHLTYNGRLVVYQGRLDLLAIDDDGYIIVDHKTAGKFNPTTHLEMDEQTSSYAWAMRQLGFDIHSIIYNELKKSTPEYPQVLKSGKLSKDKTCTTTPKLYREALARQGLSEVGYTDHLAWLELNPPDLFRRTIVRKTSKELDIIGERILLEALDMLDDPSIYPSPSSNYSCVKCDFRMPCLATNDGSNVEIILQRGYRPRVD